MKTTNLSLKGISTFFICILVITACSPSQNKNQLITSSFNELTDPNLSSYALWSDNSKGFHSSFVSIDDKYNKSEEPTIKSISYNTTLTGWQGETLSAQILVWSKDSINNLTFNWTDFKGNNKTLPADIAKVRFVRYTLTDEFSEGCGFRVPENYASSLTPDMLDNINCMDLEPSTVRPLWITVNIPRNIDAGEYESVLTLTSDNESQSFSIKVKIQNATLAKPQDWSYHLDLWQHPAAVARTENLELWSEEHFEALKPLMKMLANAGQKVITTTLNKDPWNNQCYDTYEDMIIWTKHKDGSWSFDYTIFDKWVHLMLNLGVNKMINCYSVVPWNNELHYFDEQKNEFVDVQANPGTDTFNTLWHYFFSDFKKHLKSKGWLEITNIAMDERTPDEMAKTIEMLQKEAPELGISYADNQKSYKKYPFIKDISLAAGASFDSKDIKERRSNNNITTYYVCCSDSFPNTFTFSHPAEAVYAGWYALAADFDGMLRWAYNSWVENPLTDSRFRTWPAGDTFIVYPQARSSIRFERLIEGIQDVEKIKTLITDLKTSDRDDATQLLTLLNKCLSEFNTVNPEQDFVQMIHEGKDLIHKITAYLYQE